MTHFTVAEMVHSNTAERLGIYNEPDAQTRVRLTETIRLLECVRAEWEDYCERHALGTSAIRISSGYRSAALNKAVGGVKNSAHMLGYAADLQPVNGHQAEFDMGYAFDQIIIEQSKTARWVHVGYKRADGKQRRECFALKV